MSFILLAILLLAGSLRLRAVLETITWPALQGDSVDYVSAAYNLRHFDVFSRENTWSEKVQVAPKPDAVRDPGYSFLLASLLPDRPDPHFLDRALLLQALIGTLTVGLTWLLAVQLLPKPAALAVTALVAINPQMIELGTTLLTETLFAFLVVASLCAMTRALLRRSIVWYAATGVLLGLSALVRPTLEFLPLLLLPALAWLVPDSRWKPCLALLLGMVLSFGPWIVRNEHTIGAASDPLLMRNTLLHGSYADFMYHDDPHSLGFPYRFDPQEPEIHTPGQALTRIRQNFAADPGRTLRWYLLSKPIHFFDWNFLEGQGDIFINTTLRSPYLEGQRDFVVTYAVASFLHWPLVALGYLGIAIALVAAVRNSGDRRLVVMGQLAVVMVFVIALHMIGFPLGRYSVPFRPLTYLLAMFVPAVAIGWLRTKKP